MDYIDSQEWVKKYDRMKFELQGKRKIGPSLSQIDSRDFYDRLASLEKELNIMKESPMEYDMYAFNE
jgi:hypothetical protein